MTTPQITSLTNERVKLVHTLQTQTRARRKHGMIALEGTRLIRDALERSFVPEFAFVELEHADPTLVTRLEDAGVELLAVSPAVLAHISDTQTPQGIVAVLPMPSVTLPPALTRVLILDAVRDPGNLGTLLRTAAAAGVDAVLLAPDCADVYNPKVLRSGMGAHFRLTFAVLDWIQIADRCKSLNIYAADYPGDLRYDLADWRAGWALIIGSEAHGISAAAANLAATRVYIPMAAETESLNAAQAAAVILFEAARQRS